MLENTDKYILNDIDFNVQAGDKILIVGKNGAGKSTLLNLITGELEPTKGTRNASNKINIGK